MKAQLRVRSNLTVELEAEKQVDLFRSAGIRPGSIRGSEVRQVQVGQPGLPRGGR